MKGSVLLVCLFAAVAAAQQPNTATARLTVNNVNGPPWPITSNVAPASLALVRITGNPNAPFALYASGTRTTAPGSANVGGNIVDLPLTPAPAAVINGYPSGTWTTGPTGTYLFSVGVPLLGLPPTGLPSNAAAIQAVVADPTMAIGWRATAATQANIVMTLPLGNNTTLPVNIAALGLTFPFYGANYTLMNVDSNGYITFGAPIPSQTSSDPWTFDSGPPRIAGFWTDLDPTLGGAVKVTSGSLPPGTGQYVRVDWVGVPNWGIVGPPAFTFSIYLDSTGFIQIIHPPTLPASLYDLSVGISSGGNLSVALLPKNLLGILTTSPFSYLGGVNENFHGYYGIITLMPYYLGPTDNPYNLSGFTLHFTPMGAGTLPAASNRYVMY